MRTDAFHPYQRYCVDYVISHPRCALFLDMGLGKTAITLKAIDELMYDFLEIRRVLVIAPLRVAKATWTAETEKWEDLSHLTINRAVGGREDRVRALAGRSDIVVINRENTTWLWEWMTCNDASNAFDMVVVDESSGFKNRNAKRWKSCVKLSFKAKRTVLLTGTPVPNGYEDLWPQIYLLDGGERLGRHITDYRKRYYKKDTHGGHFNTFTILPGAVDAIDEQISDICVSMKSEDYLQLPDRIYADETIELPKEAQKTYDRMERDLLVSLSNDSGGAELITAANAAVVTGKLLQIAGGAVYNEDGQYIRVHDEKTERLKEILDDNEGKNVMVFYNYRSEKDRLMRDLKDYHPSELKDEKDIAKWNKGEIPLLLVNPASAGHGLNLQAGGHIIVWYSLTWNLELYEQANKRLHRQGQTEPVIIHHLIAKGTIDEVVLKRLRSKGRTQDELLEYIKARVYDETD